MPDEAKAAMNASGSMAEGAVAVDKILDQHLPVGWPAEHPFTVDVDGSPTLFWKVTSGPENLWQALIGWVLTAFATLFGAPFWFDALQTVVRLKGTGPSPDDVRDGTAASR